jgi:hypothetical protein
MVALKFELDGRYHVMVASPSGLTIAPALLRRIMEVLHALL